MHCRNIQTQQIRDPGRTPAADDADFDDAPLGARRVWFGLRCGRDVTNVGSVHLVAAEAARWRGRVLALATKTWTLKIMRFVSSNANASGRPFSMYATLLIASPLRVDVCKWVRARSTSKPAPILVHTISLTDGVGPEV